MTLGKVCEYWEVPFWGSFRRSAFEQLRHLSENLIFSRVRHLDSRREMKMKITEHTIPDLLQSPSP